MISNGLPVKKALGAEGPRRTGHALPDGEPRPRPGTIVGAVAGPDLLLWVARIAFVRLLVGKLTTMPVEVGEVILGPLMEEKHD
jgi:hypothetical protein